MEPRAEEEEIKEAILLEEQKWAVKWDQVCRRYWVGNYESTEYGLEQNGKNAKIEIKAPHPEYHQKITIDDRCYNSKTHIFTLERKPFEFVHRPLGWAVKLGF